MVLFIYLFLHLSYVWKGTKNTEISKDGTKHGAGAVTKLILGIVDFYLFIHLFFAFCSHTNSRGGLSNRGMDFGLFLHVWGV